ncbi:response regulator transcription factor [Paenarthrobacter sp. NPDC090520]|uniref:response regulator transcription factor n=1 Tax=Paenarthrobacter sp. NPDC090520 TaxID=3364382 RepID=UPI003809FF99
MNNPFAVVIEDDPDLGQLIGTVLETMGYTVHIATTGPAGVQAVTEHRPSMITTDLGLPHLGGAAVTAAIRETTDAPILVISASNDPGQVEDALTAGASGYLLKPFNLCTLRTRIDALHHGAAPAPQQLRS